jgi:hypothetical protein
MNNLESDIKAYQVQFGTILQEDLVLYAKNRNKKVAKKFVEFGIMKLQTGKNAPVKYSPSPTQLYYWDSSKPLGKLCCKYFLQLVSGLSLQWILFQSLVKRSRNGIY